MEIKREDRILKALLVILIISAFTSGLALDVGTISINLSQLTAILLLFLLFVYSAVNKKSWVVLYKDSVSIFIYLYFFSNLFSSLFFSPVRFQSLKGCGLILTYVLIYVSVRWVMKFMIDQQAPIRRMMRLNYWSALFGLTCMVISFLQGGKENIGASLGQLGTAGIETISRPLPSIQSLSVEPNIFAIITAVILCLHLSVYILGVKTKGQLTTIIVLSVAVLFAYTRSVYVALILALLVLLFLSRKIRLLLSLVNYGIVLVLLIGTLFIILPDDNDVKHALVSRATTLFDFSHGSGAGRVQGYIIGLEGFKKNPAFGNGTLSADTRFYNSYERRYQERMGSAGWLNGVLIQSMNDTGVFGIVIILSLFGSVLLSNYHVYQKLNKAAPEKNVVAGFIMGNIILLIASQTSSTLWVSFPYIYWGINMAFLQYCRKQQFEKIELKNGNIANGAEIREPKHLS
ncbi:MAG: O-antigen ligase family protein [Bacteroidetes bacterium]|nr:O-antigen ligase family protein [Bacteroidota bacterium]